MIIDFAQNLNVLGPPEWLIAAISQNAELISCYPSPRLPIATRAVADSFEISEESVLLGAGTTELFLAIARAFGQTSATLFTPSYWGYSHAQSLCPKSVIKRVALDASRDFYFDPAELIGQRSPGDVVYFCNPNNPTSRLLTKESIRRLLEADPDCICVVDETYLLFREDYAEESVISWTQAYKNLIVCTSLSKFFCVPGLRIGLLACHPTRTMLLREQLTPYGVTPFAEQIIPSLLRDRDFVERSRQHYAAEREYMLVELRRHLTVPAHVIPSQANFFFLGLGDLVNSSRIVEQLRESGFLVRDGAEFPGLSGNWIRFAIRTREENCKFIDGLNAVLRKETLRVYQ